MQWIAVAVMGVTTVAVGLDMLIVWRRRRPAKSGAPTTLVVDLKGREPRPP